MNQMTAMSMSHSKDTTKILVEQEEFRNTPSYVCSSHHYYQAYVYYSFTRNKWHQSIPFGYTRLLPAKSPPFEPSVVPTYPVSAYRLIVNAPNGQLYTTDEEFIPGDDA